MAMRIETMSTPSKQKSPSLGPGLTRKVVLLFLLVVAATLGLVILFQRYNLSPAIVLTVFADGSLGLLAGFSARIIMHRRSGLVRFFSAVAALTAGLILLGWLTSWEIGIGPVGFGRRNVDWFGLAHLTFGTVTVVLALRAWIRQTPHVSMLPVEPPPPPSTFKKHRKKNWPPDLSTSKISFGLSKLSTWTREKTKSRPNASSRLAQRPSLSVQPGVDIERTLKPKRRSALRRRRQVQLAAAEEHRCPYCLDRVKTNDPRGAVECKVCHSLHHADCWTITGTCQVPHYNT